MKNLLWISLLAIVGCMPELEKPKSRKSYAINGSTVTLITIDHDGHTFLYSERFGYPENGCLIHHPGCDCERKDE